MIITQKPSKNYTKISNAFLLDENLSGDAKIVGVLLMSFPNDWEVNITHLSNVLKKGETTIRKAIKELINVGKLSVSQIKDKKGRFSNAMLYEFKGEVEEIILEESDLEEQSPKTNLTQQSDVKVSESRLNPSDKKTDSGNFATHIKNKSLYKEKYILLQTSAKFVLLNGFKKQKNILENLNKLLNALSTEELKAYEDFIAYRKEKHKITLSTKEAIAKKLLKLKESGNDITACITQSIERGWSGIFEICKTKNNAHKPKKEVALNKLSFEEQLHHQILEVLGKNYPNFRLDFFPENRVKMIDHPKLGFVGVIKEKGLLKYLDESLNKGA